MAEHGDGKKSLPLPSVFEVVVSCPFHSRLVVDHRMLAGRYQAFREAVAARLDVAGWRYCDEWRGETARAAAGEAGEAGPAGEVGEAADGADGLGEAAEVLRKPEFDHTSSGTIDRSDSLACLDRAAEAESVVVKIDADAAAAVGLPATLTLEDVRLSWHEYRAGILQAVVRVDLDDAPEPTAVTALVSAIRRALPESRAVHALIEAADQAVAEAGAGAKKAQRLPGSVFNENDYHRGDRRGLLWSHAVVIFDEHACPTGAARDMPCGEASAGLLAGAHHGEPMDMAPTISAFAHLGWGRSLLAGLGDNEKRQALNTLRLMQIDWLAGDHLNRALTRRLDLYAMSSHREVRQRLRWIENVRVEVELYEAHRSLYLQVASPFAYGLYQKASVVWRFAEQRDGHHRKLQSLNELYSQAHRVVDRRFRRIFASLGAVIAALAVISAFADGVFLAWPDYDRHSQFMHRVALFSASLLLIATGLVVLGYLAWRHQRDESES